jgi:RNA polymerase sigma factor (sigma-70 family)
LVVEKIREYLLEISAGQEPSKTSLEAWRRFYARYQPLIERFAAACHVDPADRADCAQQVWVKLLTEVLRGSYDPQLGDFNHWLYALVRNEVVSMYRKRGSKPAASLSESDLAHAVSTEEDPAAALDRDSTRIAVQEAMQKLQATSDARSYSLIQQYWFEGRPLYQIATDLGLSFEQAKLRHFRMKRKLRLLLATTAEPAR